MKKIPSLFQRDFNNRLVVDKITPGTEWVLAGEGKATVKVDGTCCLVRAGKLFKRYEVKPGGTPPPNFEPANEVDENTGKQQGWLPVGDGPEDKYHREAFRDGQGFLDGTYELLGPKVQGNPEKSPQHRLVSHNSLDLDEPVPTGFNELRAYLGSRDIEGIVWHHPDGRMVKIKGKDFGLKRF